MLLDALGIEIENDDRVEVFVLSQNPSLVSGCMDIVRNLRSRGVSAETEYTGRSLKAQFRYADKIKAKYAVVIGESEMEQKVVTIKNLANGVATSIALDEIADFVANNR